MPTACSDAEYGHSKHGECSDGMMQQVTVTSFFLDLRTTTFYPDRYGRLSLPYSSRGLSWATVVVFYGPNMRACVWYEPTGRALTLLMRSSFLLDAVLASILFCPSLCVALYSSPVLDARRALFKLHLWVTTIFEPNAASFVYFYCTFFIGFTFGSIIRPSG